jgi:predicted DNA-binding protein with PD1-like motif
VDKTPSRVAIKKMKEHAFRLKKGDDLRLSIENYAKQNNIKAAVIVSAVGHLSKTVLRNASATKVITLDQDVEIVSITGTISPEESHIHIAVSDENLKTYGGHLKAGSLVGITAEIVLLELENYTFSRKLDDTGYECLVVTHKN